MLHEMDDNEDFIPADDRTLEELIADLESIKSEQAARKAEDVVLFFRWLATYRAWSALVHKETE